MSIKVHAIFSILFLVFASTHSWGHSTPINETWNAPENDRGNHYILLLEPIHQLTRMVGPKQLVASKEGVSIIRLKREQLSQWSHQVHEALGFCGGYVDITKEIRQGIQPDWIIWKEVMKRQIPARHFGFRLKLSRSIASLVEAGSEKAFWNFLATLTAFPDRSATTENGVKAAKYLGDYALSLRRYRSDLKVTYVPSGWFYKQPSVLVTLPGSDRNAGGVVIGGHFDTFSGGKPGADDDGSGSAVVMESLRAVIASGARFRRDLHFIWYAAEERGLVGSKNVVSYFSDQKIPVRAAMQFDMVGWNSSKDKDDIYLIQDYTNAELTGTVAQLISQYVGGSVGYTRCGYACSDHASWHRAGIPVVFPFESSFSGMNQKLHTAGDLQQILDSKHAFRFVKVSLAFLGEMAELVSVNR